MKIIALRRFTPSTSEDYQEVLDWVDATLRNDRNTDLADIPDYRLEHDHNGDVTGVRLTDRSGFGITVPATELTGTSDDMGAVLLKARLELQTRYREVLTALGAHREPAAERHARQRIVETLAGDTPGDLSSANVSVHGWNVVLSGTCAEDGEPYVVMIDLAAAPVHIVRNTID